MRSRSLRFLSLSSDVLRSLRLLRNWHAAWSEYMLYRLLRRGISVTCRDGSRAVLRPSAFRLLARHAVGCVGGNAVLNGGVEVPLAELDALALEATRRGWRYEHGYWIKNGVKFRHMRWPVLEVFEFGEYNIDVSGMTVVDVGAYVGETAVYFAARGARRVIAIEPHPEAYREMLENIKLNGLEDKIIPINAGLADRPGKICLENVDIIHTIGTHYRPGECVAYVPAITLGEVLDNYVGNNDRPLLLKMDCEGCEHDVVLNDRNVEKFDVLYFEYHGTPVQLLRKLVGSYKCRIVSGVDYYVRHGGTPRELGFIRCDRLADIGEFADSGHAF